MTPPRIHRNLLVPLAVLAGALAGTQAHAQLLVPPSGSDVVLADSGDDFSVGPRNIGFSFTLFGTTATEVFVNSNGNLSFGSGNTTFSNPALPTGSPPRIAPFWDDVDLPPGKILENTSVAGQYTAIWNGVTTFSDSAARLTFETILLGPGNSFGLPANSILFSYDSVTGANDNNVTVGLNGGNSVLFETLNDLGVGGPNGVLTEAQAIELSGKDFLFRPVYDQGRIVDYNVSVYDGNVVPEGTPAPWALAAGMLAVGYLRHRRKSAAQG